MEKISLTAAALQYVRDMAKIDESLVELLSDKTDYDKQEINDRLEEICSWLGSE